MKLNLVFYHMKSLLSIFFFKRGLNISTLLGIFRRQKERTASHKNAYDKI